MNVFVGIEGHIESLCIAAIDLQSGYLGALGNGCLERSGINNPRGEPLALAAIHEYTNRLLRQYFPKGTVLYGFSQPELDLIAAQLNQRPRKTLGYRSPAEEFHDMLR